ncbi:MAG: excinuclease ABC subunit UvrA, partial [Chthoniobacterales bacterium]
MASRAVKFGMGNPPKPPLLEEICGLPAHLELFPVGSKVAEKECVIAPFETSCVEIRGARQNNLKGIDVDLPLGKLTVVTGPSGSGKSSLAFETIYAEGQRRYVETFSPYMRQFLDRMDKPRVDDIRGIPPAIAIEQSNPVKTSRSTVGTMTEINDYLKLLWPRVAKAFCPSCGREIRPETAKSIADQIVCHFEGSREIPLRNRSVSSRDPSASLRFGQDAENIVLITFWVAVPAKTEPRRFFEFLQQQGYLRVWIDNQIVRVDVVPKKLKRLGPRVQVIQDRIAMIDENRARLVEAIETALRFGKGKVNVVPLASDSHPSSLIPHPFSTGWHCAHCDLDIRPPTPGLFSFNNPLGACPECRGFGRTIALDLNKAIPDRSLSIRQGVVRAFRGLEFGESQKDLLRACARQEIDIDVPFEELPKADQQFVIAGEKRSGEYTDEDYENDRWYGVRGFFRWLESKTYKMHVRVLLSRYRAYTTCPMCSGGRFQPEALNYKVVAAVCDPRENSSDAHRAPLQLSLPEFAALPISDGRDFLAQMEIVPNDSTAEMLREEICARLNYLCEVGAGYLTLDRSTRTLSGGEVQRVNLTTCLGASLVNTLFVMDEPSVGLHPRDVGRLVRAMHNLRDKGNTLLVVEHEEQIIRAADNLIDVGPGRGERGGELIWNGALQDFLAHDSKILRSALILPSRTFPADENRAKRRIRSRDTKGTSSPQNAATSTLPACAPQSLTRDYLTGHKSIPIPKTRQRPTGSIKIAGARQHNLKNIDVDIPLGVLTCVTGVSGSGKSTLIHDVLYRNLLVAKGQQCDHEPGVCKSVTGAHRIGEVIMVDQSPLTRTPRSTPILYLGLYDRVRELFAAQPEAMSQGLTASAFSFNSGAGRCERCSGTGFEKIEMQFLSDLYVRCAECEGKRFQPHVLKVQVQGKSIHDLLELTVTEAIQFFAEIGQGSGLRSFPQSAPEQGQADRYRPGDGSPGAPREERMDRSAEISDRLKVLAEVGLGYLRLGQPLNTLSGGESQRLKLVRHLTEGENVQRPNGKAIRHPPSAIGNLFIFDEPTTGLHFDDVSMLLGLFQRLVKHRHSIVVIEHNLEVIKCADWIVDLGPEAGEDGGEVVATGTPEEVAIVERSHTGKFLRAVLGSAPKAFGAVRGTLPRTAQSVYP